MQPYDEIKKYSETICEQIRWKKARTMIAEELENHICDQRDAYMSEGKDEVMATRDAIAQMGDAVTVGIALDKTHKPKPQWTLFILTYLLILTGAGVSYLTRDLQAPLDNISVFLFILTSGIFLLSYFLDFSILGKYPKQCYYLTILISVIGLMFSKQVNGRAWFALGRLSSSMEYLSLLFPLSYSLLIYSMRKKGYFGIVLCGLGYIPLGIILLIIPTATGFALYTISALIILCTAIMKGWFGESKKFGLVLTLFPVICSTTLAAFWLAMNAYRLSRISALLNPSTDPRGYQILLIRDILAKAEFIGKGSISQQFGVNDLKMSILGTDYALTALTHHYGWITFLGIVVLFTIFTALGLFQVSRQKSVLGTMVSLSVLLTIVIQVITYSIGNLGYGLLSPISLPLVSYGKAAMLINAGLIGFMLSVFRTDDIRKDGYKTSVKHGRFINYKDGKLILYLKG